MNPYIIIGIFTGLLTAFGSGYHLGESHQKDRQLAQQAVIEETAKKTREIVAQEISKIRINNRTIYQKVEREIVEKPVYINTHHEPAVLQQLNDALSGRAYDKSTNVSRDSR